MLFIENLIKLKIVLFWDMISINTNEKYQNKFKYWRKFKKIFKKKNCLIDRCMVFMERYDQHYSFSYSLHQAHLF
jgi:hypothetical protein